MTNCVLAMSTALKDTLSVNEALHRTCFKMPVQRVAISSPEAFEEELKRLENPLDGLADSVPPVRDYLSRLADCVREENRLLDACASKLARAEEHLLHETSLVAHVTEAK